MNLKRLRFNRFAKILNHINELEKYIEIESDYDKKKITALGTKLHQIVRKVRILSKIRIAFYIVLYASLITAFTSGIRLLSFFGDFMSLASGLIGTGVAAAIIGFLGYLVNTYFGDLVAVSSHMIAIYAKHDTEDTPELLEFFNLMK